MVTAEVIVYEAPNSAEVIENSGDGIFVIARDGTVVLYTERCRELTGFAREDVLGGGFRCSAVFGCNQKQEGDSATGVLCPSGEIEFAKHVSRKRMCVINKETSGKRWIDITYHPILGEDGEPAYIVAIVTDATAQIKKEKELHSKTQRLEKEIHALQDELHTRYGFSNIVSRDSSMRRVFDQIQSAGKSRSNVMIFGESGTGKELIARAIHNSPEDGGGPFIGVNCAALPAHLIESELFGHVKGAFTDASADSKGLFRAADKGAIFLDEIAEMPLETQAKLLRVIQDRKVRPVGSTESYDVDVRILAATNIPQEECLKRGKLRDDLFYRLAVITLELPPLRDRRDDIPFLVQHFLQRMRRKFSRTIRGIDPDAMEILYNYDWPGNIRELENAIEGAAAIGMTDRIQLIDLPRRIVSYVHEKRPPFDAEVKVVQDSDSISTMKEAVLGVELKLIKRALLLSGGNKTKAAELLDIPRKQLYRKMESLGID
ncbi:MAG: sigma 54-interacting transcriptional regulator [Planctomycetes bacterium]|nr:sigma 54-interacting transcriptional regulator [Planctomycetota bacterium]